ncbi:hypothetical protein NDU88_002525 [Pleurodeles waltl]|uniref:Uncharacterized protein n=1 Tax=Pleurodeles waltl TaxID=8319 RepID=A0AAV7TMV6_PLEWA|nr:hypothetical protein NDU88_002525 [Pleurodeles waltl]
MRVNTPRRGAGAGSHLRGGTNELRSGHTCTYGGRGAPGNLGTPTVFLVQHHHLRGRRCLVPSRRSTPGRVRWGLLGRTVPAPPAPVATVEQIVLQQRTSSNYPPLGRLLTQIALSYNYTPK